MLHFCSKVSHNLQEVRKVHNIKDNHCLYTGLLAFKRHQQGIYKKKTTRYLHDVHNSLNNYITTFKYGTLACEMH